MATIEIELPDATAQATRAAGLLTDALKRQQAADSLLAIAALLWHGPSHALLAQVRSGSLGLVSSPALLAKLADVLGRSKFDAILKRSNASREKALAEVRQLDELIEPPPLPQPVCSGHDDDELLALAIAAQADLIISCDIDLLVVQQFNGMLILSPAQAAA
ncbi:MAG: putative toxin-antitoxin system toxin component, PIN family [Burkholderiales bacterium]|nr:putative toxin-antitoxin system toxin component, PIN family [Burkholderiales bacterium]